MKDIRLKMWMSHYCVCGHAEFNDVFNATLLMKEFEITLFRNFKIQSTILQSRLQ